MANCTILIIEDDPGYLDNMQLILAMEGYTVHTATDGAAGLKLLEHLTPDLVLCDIMMPVMDGHCVLEHLKQAPRYAEVAFIFITALAERADVRKGMAAGADDYLSKPFSAEELLAAVRGRLSRRASLRQNPPLQVQDTALLTGAISPRELEVLALVGTGATSRQIADHLGISIRTVENHRKNIMNKLDVSNAASLGYWASLARQLEQDSR